MKHTNETVSIWNRYLEHKKLLKDVNQSISGSKETKSRVRNCNSPFQSERFFLIKKNGRDHFATVL
jgi:hypothetical protein